MAATFEWDERNGAPAGTVTHTVTQVNWKNTDDVATAYSSSPITDGNNSFDKWQFGHFSGTYNQISAGLFAHTAGTFGAGLTLKGPVAASTSMLTYAQPSTTANSNLTTDMTSAIAIGSGVAVYFGATDAAPAGKAASTTANPAYTNYLTTQLQTSGASPGDTASVTLTLQYDEN